jgi:hypothetical protein
MARVPRRQGPGEGSMLIDTEWLRDSLLLRTSLSLARTGKILRRSERASEPICMSRHSMVHLYAASGRGAFTPQ